jgi:hypothetical protein
MFLQQVTFGFLIFENDEEVPVITERLRNKPLGEWQPDEFGEEMEAQAAADKKRAEHLQQYMDEMEWLRAVCEAFEIDPPDSPTGELEEFLERLPEPGRATGRAILRSEVPFEALFERINRQSWHRSVDSLSVR